MTDFTSLGLAAPLLAALTDAGYTVPTPIQTQAIPHLLAGRDLLGIAQTGTGKTAAFALPILHRLAANRRAPGQRRCRVLVLSPTRELATQIAESFRTYGRHLKTTVAVVFGGVGHVPQERAMAQGVDVLVACPGRLLDHMGTGGIRLDATEILVLDEADQMLDLGFVKPIRRIVAALPKARQSLLFSATMPNEAAQLSAEILKEPVRVAVAPVATTAERVEQQVLLVEHGAKRELTADLFADPALSRTLVFTRTKRGADRVTEHLEKRGISAAAIHGNKSQGARERALALFKAGRIRALVATDIAARGIDVDAVSHVINYDLPNVPESYVHRIGRTARAGAGGQAISLCAGDERAFLRDIEKLIRQRLPVTARRGEVRDTPPDEVEPRRDSRAQRPQGRPQGQRPQAPRDGQRSQWSPTADATPEAAQAANNNGGSGRELAGMAFLSNGRGTPNGRPGDAKHGPRKAAPKAKSYGPSRRALG